MQLCLVLQYFNIIVPLKEQADLKPVKEEPYGFSLLRPQNRAMQTPDEVGVCRSGLRPERQTGKSQDFPNSLVAYVNSHHEFLGLNYEPSC